MTRLNDFKGFIGDLARPWAIWCSAFAASVATIRIAWIGQSLDGGAIFITAAWGGVAALYGAKAWEITKTGKTAGDVEIARTAPPPPAPGTAVLTAAADVDATLTVTETSPAEGELPRDQRVRP